MPRLAVTNEYSSGRTCPAMESLIRAARAIAWSMVVSGKTTTNSSPP